MTEPLKKGQISFTGAEPMVLTEVVGENFEGLSEEQQAFMRQIGKTVAAYMKAAKDLLTGKLAHLREWAPRHLTEPGNVLVTCCLDGVVVRFEAASDSPRVFSGWMPGSLSDVAGLVSQNLIRCHPDKNYVSTVATTGTELKLSSVKQATGETTELASIRISFEAVIERPVSLPLPPQKPFCLLSVRNTIEIQLLGELLSTEPNSKPPQPFLARSLLRLPVGWDCIEVFPFVDLASWQPEYAATWAENDILGAVVSHQFRENQLHNLDPNVEARRRFAKLFEDYKALLDSEPREEALQSFLAANPALLCPTHTKVWPKLSLGARKTDFVFQDAIGDFLLVEIEKSTHPLFIRHGDTSRELNHARGQVQDWKRYLEDNLPTVQRELGLTGISVDPRALVVMGRSSSLSPEHRRKLVTLENEAPKLKIMTYDDVLDNAKAVVENLLGLIWNVQGNTQIYYLPAASVPRRA